MPNAMTYADAARIQSAQAKCGQNMGEGSASAKDNAKQGGGGQSGTKGGGGSGGNTGTKGGK